MSSQNPENPKTTETGEGGGYGDPTPEQELGQTQDPHRQDPDREQAAAPEDRRETPGQTDQDRKVRAQEELAGDQQDPVTGEALGPGGAESPA
jgi:hypothetical protein